MVGLIAPLFGGVVLAKQRHIQDDTRIYWNRHRPPLSDHREKPASTEGDALGIHCRQHAQDSLSITTTDTASSEVHPATPESTESRPKNPLPTILTLLISRRLLVALWTSPMVAATYIALEALLPLQTQPAFC